MAAPMFSLRRWPIINSLATLAASSTYGFGLIKEPPAK